MVFDMPTCAGCRTCEIACSFHRTGEFKPLVSSIRILDKKENGGGFSVLLAEKEDSQTIACDGCKDLDAPFCMLYCHSRKELRKIINEFLKR